MKEHIKFCSKLSLMVKLIAKFTGRVTFFFCQENSIVKFHNKVDSKIYRYSNIGNISPVKFIIKR